MIHGPKRFVYKQSFERRDLISYVGPLHGYEDGTVHDFLDGKEFRLIVLLRILRKKNKSSSNDSRVCSQSKRESFFLLLGSL